jgi:Tol biopolymer transport system component
VIADDLGEADVFVYDIERRSWTQLTRGLHSWSQLAWSPDGTWIFFTSFRSGNAELFRVPSRGGDAEQLTSDLKYWEYPTSVSPDGRILLFFQTESAQSDLMILKLDPRGAPEHLTNSPGTFEFAPSISPSGRWVAYTSNASGNNELHVRSFPDGGQDIRLSPAGVTRGDPLWSRDGRELYFQRNAEIWAVPVAAGDTFKHGEPRLLFEADFPERSSSYLASGPVGDRFVAVRREPPHYQLVYIPNWLDEWKQAGRQ